MADLGQVCAQVSPVTGVRRPLKIVASDGPFDVQLVNDSGDISSTNTLPVSLPPLISDNNSTTTPLGAGGVYTGTADIINGYGIVYVNIFSDKASATDGLSVQQSSDGTNWDHTDEFSIAANTGKNFSINPHSRYFRIVYTNGAAAQGVFRLQTIFKCIGKSSSHRIQDAIITDDDAELVKAVITGENPAGDFVNFTSTTQGNFKISLEEFENAVSTNSNTQLRTTLYDEGGIPISIDDSTETLQIIGYEHHEIHSGNHYNICDYQNGNGLGDTIEFVVTTVDSGKWGHLTFSVYSSTGSTIEIYEGTNTVVGGTSITPRNNNRNSANTSDMVVLKDPTSLVDGTRAAGYLAGAGRSAGAVARENEYVLKQNETYLFRITSLAASNNISWCFEWYEHTDKN